MKTTNEPTRELIELKLICPWEKNPRGAELRDMEGFTEQIRMEGIREDVHVFRDAQGVLRLMQGHRRREAAGRLGLEVLWAKVWPFDESEAFLHLLTMQNGADPFDAREMALAARTAVGMGIAKEALVGAMHRSSDTVQLYLDLGTLPPKAQEAVYNGKLALGTAGLLRQLEKEQQLLALENVLDNPITREPMTESQARVFIENRFILPAKQAKKWMNLKGKVKRELVGKGMDGGLIDVVEWEQREQFVMSGATPQAAFAMAEEHIEDSLLVNPGEPMTWGELAISLGVPWHVAPAPSRKDEYLCLVKMSAVRDADDVKGEGWCLKGKAWRRMRNDECRMTNEMAGAGKDLPVDDELGERELQRQDAVEAEVKAGFDLERWRGVAGRLMERPEAAMQDRLWKPLIEHALSCALTRLPVEYRGVIRIEMGRDESVNRRGLRWVLLLTLACAMADGGVEEIAEVEAGLGIVK